MDRKLLILSVDPKGLLTLEENPFPGYILSGIADWLSMYAESEMLDEMTEDEDSAEDT